MLKIKKLPANTHGLDYFTSDIHGCYDVFVEELARNRFDPETDRVFCCGDLIDQGPDSARALSLLDKPWFHMIKGDHEQLACFAMNRQRKDDIRVWSQDGGAWFYQLPKETQDILVSRYQDKLCMLPNVIEVPQIIGKQVFNFGIIHAELPVGAPWWSLEHDLADADVLENYLLFSRKRIKSEDPTLIEGIDVVVSGHTPVRKPTVFGNQIYIDAGSAFTEEISILTARDIIALLEQANQSHND